MNCKNNFGEYVMELIINFIGHLLRYSILKIILKKWKHRIQLWIKFACFKRLSLHKPWSVANVIAPFRNAVQFL